MQIAARIIPTIALLQQAPHVLTSSRHEQQYLFRDTDKRQYKRQY